jgi:hypothetical protein
MNITFVHSEIQVVAGAPVVFVVEVDGRRVDARIDWPTLAAVSGTADAEAVLKFVTEKRGVIEGVIRAHLLAQGVPLSRLLVLGPGELAGV